jgi:uncharacterized protein YutE (UPF0331/DUF86 family)
MSNSLDSIIDWYRIASDSMRLASRVVRKRMRSAIKQTYSFAGMNSEDAVAMFDKSQGELDNVVILALVAAFERMLRQHLVNVVATSLTAGLRETMSDSIERWSFSTQLIPALEMVPENLRGEVKQLVNFRDWVAHGHFINVPRPANVRPVDAHRRLTEFLAQAGVIQT